MSLTICGKCHIRQSADKKDELTNGRAFGRTYPLNTCSDETARDTGQGMAWYAYNCIGGPMFTSSATPVKLLTLVITAGNFYGISVEPRTAYYTPQWRCMCNVESSTEVEQPEII